MIRQNQINLKEFMHLNLYPSIKNIQKIKLHYYLSQKALGYF